MSRSRSSSEARTRRGNLSSLLVLNGLLLLGLGAITFGPQAFAQFRVRGSYLIAGGQVPGSQSGAVYVVDTVNEELIVLVFDENAKQLGGIGYRNLAADARAMLGAAAR